MPDRWQHLRVVWLYGVLGWGFAGAGLWYAAMQVSGTLGDAGDSAFAGLSLFPMAGYVAGRMMWRERQQLQSADPSLAVGDHRYRTQSVSNSGANACEIAPTWALATRVWWALSWRGMVVMFVSAVLGGLLGSVFASLFSASQALPEVTYVLAQFLGAVIGAAASVIPVRLVLGKDFGDFRLVLLGRRSQPWQASPPPPTEPQLLGDVTSIP